MRLSTATPIVLCLAPFVGAQSTPNKIQTEGPKPQISSVETSMAYEPGAVTIRGTDLGLIRQVRIGGVPALVIGKSATSLVLEPLPQEPGFARLELLSPLGTIESGIEFTPSLQASSANDTLRLTLHGGEPGPYWIYYSLELRATPGVRPGIYYASMLDLTSRPSGLATKGFSDGSPVTLAFRTPPGWTTPVHFQALCLYDTPSERSWSFSNAFSQAPVDSPNHPVYSEAHP